MSVNAENIFGLRPFAGFADPGLPIGHWGARQTVTGNATGGVQTAQVNFSVQGQGGPALYFSVEQLNVFRTDATAQLITIELQNMLGPGGIFDSPWNLSLVVDPSTGAIRAPDQVMPLPWFIGTPSQGSQGALQSRGANVDTVVQTLLVEGYFWSARSINVDGGLRRPLSGLYSP